MPVFSRRRRARAIEQKGFLLAVSGRGGGGAVVAVVRRRSLVVRRRSLAVGSDRGCVFRRQDGDRLFVGAVGSWYWQGKLHRSCS